MDAADTESVDYRYSESMRALLPLPTMHGGHLLNATRKFFRIAWEERREDRRQADVDLWTFAMVHSRVREEFWKLHKELQRRDSAEGGAGYEGAIRSYVAWLDGLSSI